MLERVKDMDKDADIYLGRSKDTKTWSKAVREIEKEKGEELKYWVRQFNNVLTKELK